MEDPNPVNYLSKTENLDDKKLRKFLISLFHSFPEEQSIIRKKLNPRKLDKALNVAFSLFNRSTTYGARLKCAHLISILFDRGDLSDKQFVEQFRLLARSQPLNESGAQWPLFSILAENLEFRGILSLATFLLAKVPEISEMNNFHAAKEYFKHGLCHHEENVRQATLEVAYEFIQYSWNEDTQVLCTEEHNQVDIDKVMRMAKSVVEDVMSDIVRCVLLQISTEDKGSIERVIRTDGRIAWNSFPEKVNKAMLILFHFVDNLGLRPVAASLLAFASPEPFLSERMLAVAVFLDRFRKFEEYLNPDSLPASGEVYRNLMESVRMTLRLGTEGYPGCFAFHVLIVIGLRFPTRIVDQSDLLSHLLSALGRENHCYDVSNILNSMLETTEDDKVATLVHMIFARICEVFEENFSHCQMGHYDDAVYVLYKNACLLPFTLRVEIRTKSRVGEVYSLYYSSLSRSLKKIPVCLANGDLRFADQIVYCVAILEEQVGADVFRGDAVDWSYLHEIIGKDFCLFAAMLLNHYIDLLTKHKVDYLFRDLYSLLMSIEDKGPLAAVAMWRSMFYPLLEAVSCIHGSESKADLCATLDAIRKCLSIPSFSADVGNADFPKHAELLLHLLRRHHRVRDVGGDHYWDKRILGDLKSLINFCVKKQGDLFYPLVEPVVPEILRLLSTDYMRYENITGLSMLYDIALFVPSTVAAHHRIIFPAVVPYLRSDDSDVRTEAVYIFQAMLFIPEATESALNFLDDINQYSTRLFPSSRWFFRGAINYPFWFATIFAFLIPLITVFMLYSSII